jgi:hypothetical protein
MVPSQRSTVAILPEPVTKIAPSVRPTLAWLDSSTTPLHKHHPPGRCCCRMATRRCTWRLQGGTSWWCKRCCALGQRPPLSTTCVCPGLLALSWHQPVVHFPPYKSCESTAVIVTGHDDSTYDSARTLQFWQTQHTGALCCMLAAGRLPSWSHFCCSACSGPH